MLSRSKRRPRSFPVRLLPLPRKLECLSKRRRRLVSLAKRLSPSSRPKSSPKRKSMPRMLPREPQRRLKRLRRMLLKPQSTNFDTKYLVA